MRNQAKQALRMLIAEIDEMDCDAWARLTFKRLVIAKCNECGVSGIENTERIMFARELIDEKMPKSVIVLRVMTRFGISRSAAYRAIQRALHFSQNRA